MDRAGKCAETGLTCVRDWGNLRSRQYRFERTGADLHPHIVSTTLIKKSEPCTLATAQEGPLVTYQYRIEERQRLVEGGNQTTSKQLEIHGVFSASSRSSLGSWTAATWLRMIKRS